jgi:hypothetical protein
MDLFMGFVTGAILTQCPLRIHISTTDRLMKRLGEVSGEEIYQY